MRLRLARLAVLVTASGIVLVVLALLAATLLVLLWPGGAAFFGDEPLLD